ncbi:MAG: DUF1501 domain-containing protein [Planctomycetes bacterium]|nr:DUF1501 domain-containing protein [Planctomycetota bacterium]
MTPMLPRRRFLEGLGLSLGAMALPGSRPQDPVTTSAKAPIRPVIDPRAPHASRPPHFQARAKRLLVIFCSGGVSHLDTFDHKPELIRRHGQPLPGANGLITFQGEQGAVTRSPWRFSPHGQTGKMVADLLPHLGALADDLCFVHSMQSKTNTHGPGENVMSTGFTFDGFPSLGAWVSHALGTGQQSLPGYVAIPDPRGKPQNSANNWGPGFLPAAFAGTEFSAAQPIRNLARPDGVSPAKDAATRAFLRELNERHAARTGGDDQMAARTQSHELAARMQIAVPRVADLAQEPAHVLALYGADHGGSRIADLRAAYARNCILARRLLEHDVRVVQLFHGAYQTGGEGISNWDGHKDLAAQYEVHGATFDQPTAALLLDLKRRGLLADTLVLWCTEFGRMPTFQKGAQGRDHNPDGFTCWLAGAGVRQGHSHGATDDFGHRAVDRIVTVHDLHATVLHLLGLDHERLTALHNGLERRLTDVAGRVVTELLA